jgi:orotidine-5'-phosphate decarboxylase
VTGRERVFVALDSADAAQAVELARSLAGHVGGFKVGLELFTAHGPAVIRPIRELGADVFLDLKLHDIPNTVARSAAVLGRLGVSFFTLHALGGPAMIRAGVEAADEAAASAGHPRPTALAVTILTSHDDGDLERIGVGGPCRPAALRLATLAGEGGAGGVVCSAQEVAEIRTLLPGATLVVPGIRPAGSSRDDQQRVATPAAAVAAGADRLVIGRPITRAPDPADAADAIAAELDAATD